MSSREGPDKLVPTPQASGLSCQTFSEFQSRRPASASSSHVICSKCCVLCNCPYDSIICPSWLHFLSRSLGSLHIQFCKWHDDGDAIKCISHPDHWMIYISKRKHLRWHVDRTGKAVPCISDKLRSLGSLILNIVVEVISRLAKPHAQNQKGHQSWKMRESQIEEASSPGASYQR